MKSLYYLTCFVSALAISITDVEFCWFLMSILFHSYLLKCLNTSDVMLSMPTYRMPCYYHYIHLTHWPCSGVVSRVPAGWVSVSGSWGPEPRPCPLPPQCPWYSHRRLSTCWTRHPPCLPGSPSSVEFLRSWQQKWGIFPVNPPTHTDTVRVEILNLPQYERRVSVAAVKVVKYCNLIGCC